jgi:hypothetical protein
MYGAVNFTVLDDVTQLSFKVLDIYKRLTTRFKSALGATEIC